MSRTSPSEGYVIIDDEHKNEDDRDDDDDDDLRPRYVNNDLWMTIQARQSTMMMAMEMMMITRLIEMMNLGMYYTSKLAESLIIYHYLLSIIKKVDRNDSDLQWAGMWILNFWFMTDNPGVSINNDDGYRNDDDL